MVAPAVVTTRFGNMASDTMTTGLFLNIMGVPFTGIGLQDRAAQPVNQLVQIVKAALVGQDGPRWPLLPDQGTCSGSS